MRYLWILMLCGLCGATLVGCSDRRPASLAEQEAQEEKMREFLNDSSPRNMNDLPKAATEFKRNIGTDTPAPIPVPEFEVPVKDRPTAQSSH